MEAANGREGLDRLAEQRPDLILLDLMMPEMDGFEFLAVLRRDPDHGKIPVIIVTAADLTEEDRARLNGGVSYILEKSGFEQQELLAQIRRLVASHASAIGMTGAGD